MKTQWESIPASSEALGAEKDLAHSRVEKKPVMPPCVGDTDRGEVSEYARDRWWRLCISWWQAGLCSSTPPSLRICDLSSDQVWSILRPQELSGPLTVFFPTTSTGTVVILLWDYAQCLLADPPVCRLASLLATLTVLTVW